MNRPRFRAAGPSLSALIAAFSVGWTAPATGQVFEGVVLETQNGRPVGRARVSLLVGDSVYAWGYSEFNGAFRLPVPGAGDYTVTVSRIGYRPLEPVTVTIGATDTMAVAVQIEPVPVFLDPIGVEAEAYLQYLDLSGYHRRERVGFGTHLGPEWVAQRRVGSMRFGDLIMQTARVTGVTTGRPGEGRSLEIFGCGGTPTFFVDDVRISGPINERVDAEEVLAVEIYGRGAGAPVRYGACSIVVWTMNSIRAR